MKRMGLLVLGLAVACGGKEAAPHTAKITQVSAPDARDVSARVSPDGRHIAFWRLGSNGFDLWVADADLKKARPLGVSSLFGGSIAPAWSGDGQRLAVPASTHSLSDVAVVDLPTDSIAYLTDTPALEVPFQFLPDGDRVVFAAYASGGTVSTFTVSRKSRAIAPLLPGVAAPAFGFVSPDGAHIAYTEFGGSGSAIWVSDSSGGARRQLTKDGYERFANLGAENPWSPDGTKILYVSTRTGKGDIWVASLDGTTRQLTSDINNDDNPAWSPDGKEVAFVSDRGRQTDVWVVPDTGGEAIRVTNDALDEAPPGWVNDSTLAFASTRSRGTYLRRAVADTVESRILPDSIDADWFQESPDRQWIAFVIRHPGSNTDLAIVRPDGSGLRVISRNAVHQSVRWNATSTKLAWASDQGGSMDVYTSDVQGDAPPVQLENWPGYDHPAYWSADGKSIVIISDRDSRLGDLWSVPLAGGDTTQLSRLGSVLDAATYSAGGREHTLVQVAGQASGEISLAEWLPGDELRTIIAGNPLFPPLPINGLLAVVLPRAGKTEVDVIRPDGSVVRSLDAIGARGFSIDDRQLIYNVQANGQLDLALLDVRTGKTTQLTHTPDDEDAAMFTAGGDSIVFRRVRSTSELMRADLGGLLRKAR
jgi:TolB protein